MAIGGLNGSDPAPTLAQFQALVASEEVHWYIAGGVGGGAGRNTGPGGGQMGGGQISGSQAGSQISAWVAESFTATTIGGITIYDLTSPTAASTSTGVAGALTT